MPKVLANGIILRDNGIPYTQFTDKDGYKIIKLNGKLRKVHRLVAEKWLTDYSKELTVDHIDCNPANNKADNLQMVTLSENTSLAHKRGRTYRHTEIYNDIGEKFTSITSACEYYKVKISSLSQCLNGRSKTCAGRKWYYA